MFQQAGAWGVVTLGQTEPSLHIWSNPCVLQSLPTLVFSWPPVWGNTITRSTVCQISGVGIRLPDPSSSWQCSAGCVGAWKINLLARKNTAGLFSTTHPCAVNRGCWNRVAGKSIKTHIYELRVSVLPPNMSSRWSNDCQSFKAESSMALFIIIAPRWASVGYCKIPTKLGTGSGKDKKISLLLFFLSTYNPDSSVKSWHFLSFTCNLVNLQNNNKQRTPKKQNKLKNASFTSFILLTHLRPVWYRIVSTFPAWMSVTWLE